MADQTRSAFATDDVCDAAEVETKTGGTHLTAAAKVGATGTTEATGAAEGEGEGEGGELWHDTRLCGRCQTFSSYLSFRSHCRICGRSVCSACRAPEVPDTWLTAPYVTLCRGIPESHQGVMKCCTVCSDRAKQSEADYLWSEILKRSIVDDENKIHWRTQARQKQDNEHMQRAAAALLKKYEDLVTVERMQYANRSFDHDKAAHRIIQHDSDLTIFDLVYNTKKLQKAEPGDIADLKVPFHFATTILSGPVAHEFVFQHLYRAHSHQIPSVFHLIAPTNREKVLKMLRSQQKQGLYMHMPHDPAVQRSFPLSMRGDVDSHRAFVDVLSMFGTADHPTRAALVNDFTAGRTASIFFQGELRRMDMIGYICRDVTEIVTKTHQKLRVFTDVDSNLINAVAFVSWPAFRTAFQGMVRLNTNQAVLVTSASSKTCEKMPPRLVYGVPEYVKTSSGGGSTRHKRKASEVSAFLTTAKQGGGVKASALKEGEGEDGEDVEGQLARQRQEEQEQVLKEKKWEQDYVKNMWSVLSTATTGTILLQCALLTVLQITTKRFIDRSKLRFTIDEKDRLVVYKAPLLDAGVSECKEEGPWETRFLNDTAAVQVRNACSKVLIDNLEYAFWVGTLLNGGEKLAEPISAMTKEHHKWIFMF